MDVHFTRRTSLDDGEPELSPLPEGGFRAVLERAQVPDEMPFLLDVEGRYDVRLNAFLRQLPSRGCRSPQTWKAYANDIACAQRFLDEKRGGRHVLDATPDDLAAYHHQRRGGGRPAIEASSWNRGVAALEKLYEWGLHAGHVEKSPFDRSTTRPPDWRRAGPGPNVLVEPDDDDGDVKCCTMAEYRVFRDVGLAGLSSVGGEEDPAFRGRNRARNLAIADFLLNTGTRITEAVSLLSAELPRLDGVDRDVKLLPMRLAPYVAKRLRGRRVMVSVRTMTEHLGRYAAVDRRHAAATGRDGVRGRRGAFASLRGPVLVEKAWPDRCRLVGGEELRYARLDARVRRSMFLVDANGEVREPAMLFLREDGMPTTADNVRAVFERACARCRDKGHHVDISPHTLRHTFAVCMLTQLMRATLRRHAVGSLIDFQGMDPAKELFRTVTLDPVDHLRRLLGHRSVETTYRYLTHVQEAREAVTEAFAEWDAVLGRPAPAAMLDDPSRPDADDEDDA